LVTLLVVSLLLVVVLAFTVYVRIELRRIENHQHRQIARANARLGMHLAVAELQRYAGADQRVTATAGILDPNPDTQTIETTASGNYEGVQSPYWTGVWIAENSTGDLPWEPGFNAHPLAGKSTENPKGIPAWLVSGNHAKTPGSDGYQTPTHTLYPQPMGDNNHVWLLHHPLNPAVPVDTETPLNDPRRIVAQVVNVASTGNAPPVRFAYHVFDEGVKVSLTPNQTDSHSGEALIARQGALENTEAFSTITSEQRDLMNRISGLGQVPLVYAPGDPMSLAHTFTPVAYRVQSDTANGGLKRDLSIAFDMPDGDFNQSPLFAASSLQREDGSLLYNGADDPDLPRDDHTWAPVHLSPMRQRTVDTTENALWGNPWHILRDYARLYIPAPENPFGPTDTLGDAPLFRARPYSFGPPNASRADQGRRASRVAQSLWHGYARDTNHIADSLMFGNSGYPYVYRHTRGPLSPIITKFATRWFIQVDDQIDGLDGSNRKRLRLVMQPSFTLWNPYNVALEVDAVRFTFRPDSGSEFVIETQLESWELDMPYRFQQEVVHNENVYRYRNSFSASQEEPGQQGNSEWASVATAASRTVAGRVWGIGALANWHKILGPKRSHWVLISEGTTVTRSGNNLNISTFSPIRFEPGEVKFFGPYDDTITEGRDPAYRVWGQSFLLQEGAFHPHSGISYDRIRTNISDPGSLNNGTDGELVLDGSLFFRATLGGWLMSGKAKSVNGNRMGAFYPTVTWARRTGNDGVSLKGDLGLAPESGLIGSRVFTSFSRLQFMDSSFEIRFHYSNAHNWHGSVPPPDSRAMVFDPAPLNSIQQETLGQTEYYLKAGDDSAEWPFRVFINNPRTLSHHRPTMVGRVGYQDVHSHIQLLNDETNIAPNLSPIPQLNGKGYYGASHGPSGEHHVMLYDIPRAPLLSLGQLQHAAMTKAGGTPAYAIGNSEISPYVASGRERQTNMRNEYHALRTDRFQRSRLAVDHSWLLNEALFDGFFFSSLLPWSDAPTLSEWRRGTPSASNPRMVPLPEAAQLDPDEPDSYRHSATALLTAGSFNVNSVSKDAWKAMFAGLNNASIPVMDGTAETLSTPTGIPLPRAQHHLNGENGPWAGYRALTEAELDRLAEEMVKEVKLRGPFLSLSDFVNRRLVNAGTEPGGRTITATGLTGALQSAINRSGINADYTTIESSRMSLYNSISNGVPFLDLEAFVGSEGGDKTMSHASGFLTQGDILQAIAPSLSARSDTFRIRFYGDSHSGSDRPARARAYGEAVVQRLPDYVHAGDAAEARPYIGSNAMPQDDLQRISPLPLQEGLVLSLDGPRYNGSPIESVEVESNLHPVNASFGRRFKIISFRWLTEDEI
jgi:hypothetical protein